MESARTNWLMPLLGATSSVEVARALVDAVQQENVEAQVSVWLEAGELLAGSAANSGTSRSKWPLKRPGGPTYGWFTVDPPIKRDKTRRLAHIAAWVLEHIQRGERLSEVGEALEAVGEVVVRVQAAPEAWKVEWLRVGPRAWRSAIGWPKPSVRRFLRLIQREDRRQVFAALRAQRDGLEPPAFLLRLTPNARWLLVRPTGFRQETDGSFRVLWALQDVNEMMLVKERAAEVQGAATLMSRCSRVLLGCPPEDAPKAMRRVLRMVAKHVCADHVALLRADFDRELLERSADWESRQAKGVPMPAVRPFTELPWVAGLIQNCEVALLLPYEEVQRQDPSPHPYYSALGVRSFGFVPIRRKEKPIGCLRFLWCSGDPCCTQTELGHLATLGEMLLTALQRAEAEVGLRRSMEALQRRSTELLALGELSANLQHCADPDEAFRTAQHALGVLFHGRETGLLVVDEQSKLRPVEGKSHHIGVSQASGCPSLTLGRPITNSDDTPPRERCPNARPGHPTLCVPMLSHGQRIGVVHLSGPEPFAPESIELARVVADRTATAVANLRLQALLREQAIRDPLTGLFNRRFLDETLEREVHVALRTGRPIGIMMLDLDGYKQFNDRHGHEAGNTVLRQVGEYLRTAIRAGDAACRYGGDEFLLILPGSGLDDTVRRANQIQQGLSELAIYHRGKLLDSISSSVGIASFPENGLGSDDVLEAADAALYQAKTEGRNRVAVSNAKPS